MLQPVYKISNCLRRLDWPDPGNFVGKKRPYSETGKITNVLEVIGTRESKRFYKWTRKVRWTPWRGLFKSILRSRCLNFHSHEQCHNFLHCHLPSHPPHPHHHHHHQEYHHHITITTMSTIFLARFSHRLHCKLQGARSFNSSSWCNALTAPQRDIGENADDYKWWKHWIKTGTAIAILATFNWLWEV